MPLVAAAENQALNALVGTNPSGNLATYASLHTAYSATGANELPFTGFTPNYARVALTWATGGAAAGSLGLQSAPSAFNVPGGYAVAFVGLWNSGPGSGGTFCGMGANGGFPAYAFTAATSGTYNFTAPGTGYAVGQPVVLWTHGQGGQAVGGFTDGTVYYVFSVSGTQFTLATSPTAGSATTPGSAGSGLVQAIAVESYAANGNFTLSAETLSILS